MSERSADQSAWQQLQQRLGRELATLPESEHLWLRRQLADIARLQEQLHAYFLTAEGEAACRDCLGACCAHGKHHLTLANLIAAHVNGIELSPDEAFTCPLLTPQGCQLPVAQRPFNCVTFICERIEDALLPAQRDDFYRLERLLRRCYEAFDRRYAGSSLRGIYIRLERLGERPLFGPSLTPNVGISSGED